MLIARSINKMYNIVINVKEKNEARKGRGCVCVCVNFSWSGQEKGLTEIAFEKDLKEVSN